VRRTQAAQLWASLLRRVRLTNRSDHSVTRVVARILRADPIVIDDIGLLAVPTAVDSTT